MDNFNSNRAHGSPLPFSPSDIFSFGSETSDSQDDDGSPATSTGEQQSPPRMRQPQPEEDAMQVDVAEDDLPSTSAASTSGGNVTRHGLKRSWQAVHAQSGEGPQEASSEPRKRQRTASSNRAPGSPEPEPMPASAATLTCDVVQDAAFIELILRHGGSRTGEASGHAIGLRLPARPSLEFRVALLCLQMLKLSLRQPFPGKEAFIPNAYAEFYHCLQAASAADEAGLLRQLLDTGLPTPPELIAPLLAAATDAGAHAAADVLRAAGDTPSGASAVTQPAPPGSTQGLPPPGWQRQVQQNLPKAVLDQVLACFAPGGDRERGLALLFGPHDKRPAGQFCIRLVGIYTLPAKTLMIACGALELSDSDIDTSDRKVCLHAGDFDRERFKAGLLDLQRQEGGDDEAFTTLMFAAQWGDLDIVRALLENGAQPDARTRNGLTALQLAAASGNASIVELLIRYLYTGNALLPQHVLRPAHLLAQLNALTENGQSALSMAAASGHYQVCALLLEAGATATAAAAAEDDEDSDDESRVDTEPLLNAARNGDAAICTLLIRHGADVNLQKPGDSAPLIYAALSGDLATCKALVAHNAKLDIVDANGNSPLSAASSFGHLHIVEYLLQQGARPSQEYGAPLTAAAALGNTDIMRVLLRHGAEVNQRKPSGAFQQTALMAACARGSIEAVKLLLEHGADPNLVINDTGDGPACALEMSNSVEIIKLLVQHGLQLHAGTPGGRHAVKKLARAAEHNQIELVELLLKLGAPADPLAVGLKPAHNPLLALDFSRSQSLVEAWKTKLILRLLLDHGAPLHHVESSGFDALMLACTFGNLALADILLRHGARIGQSSAFGRNALQAVIKIIQSGLESDDAYHDAFELLALLLVKMHRQDDWLTLSKDALQMAKHPVVRDMLKVSWLWANPQGASYALQSPINDERYLSASRALGDYLWSPATPEHRETLLVQLSLCGLTQPVLDLLMPYIDVAPALIPALVGNKAASKEALTQAMLEGIFANLEAALVAQDAWKPYSSYPVPPAIAQPLTAVAHELIRRLMQCNDNHETVFTGTAISELFELCVGLTPQPWLDSQDLPVAQAFDLDEISGPLMLCRIYAPLAEKIAAAWAAAWNSTASATAAHAEAAGWGSSAVSGTSGASSTSSASSTSAASSDSQHGAAQSGEYAFDWMTNLDDLFILDDNPDQLPFAENPVPTPTIVPQPLPQPVPQPAISFHDTPWAADMLAAFRRELQARINAPGTDILKMPGATLERRALDVGSINLQQPDPALKQAQGVYAELMLRQLHMLAQFIKGGEAPAGAGETAPASSGQG